MRMWRHRGRSEGALDSCDYMRIPESNDRDAPYAQQVVLADPPKNTANAQLTKTGAL